MRPSYLRPTEPGVYSVFVPVIDALTGEWLEDAERWAKWTGKWWCAWAIDADRAARCELNLGPRAGYRWRTQ